MISTHDSKRTTVFVMTIMLATLTVAMMAQPARAQSDRLIIANLPTGSRFLISPNGIGFDSLLEIRHDGRPTYAPTFGGGDYDTPGILSFTGKYYPYLSKDGSKVGPPPTDNVAGSITIVRWSTGIAFRISFTVNQGSIALPKGGRRTNVEMQFEGGLRLGMRLGESVFMAGTFTIIDPQVRLPLYLGGREGPFPFYAIRSQPNKNE